MNKMMDRVKLAIQQSASIICDDELDEIARAAIVVMREPTVEMLKAAKAYQSPVALACAWEAMIDEALK
jgi:hypothetical protein